MTKPITAVAIMQLYEQGRFHLTDPVAKFIPEFENMTVFRDGREQRISGQPFDEYLAEHIFRPLDMFDTFFAVPADKADRLLPLHYRDMKTGMMQLINPWFYYRRDVRNATYQAITESQ